MTTISIALSELRRLLATRLGKAAAVALTLVPTLYAGLYLYANHDPYANLDQVPAAIVVQDKAASLPDGTTLEAGSRVAKQLLDSRSFDWHQVSVDAAQRGVRNGTYDFAIVIPRGFSAAFTATANYDPTQAQLRMITNDANSYIATTIADKVSTQVGAAVSAQVGQEAATTFLTGLASVRTGFTDAADGADKLAVGAAKAQSGAGRLATGAGQVATGADTLSKGLGEINIKVTDLPSQTRQLATGARQVANADAQIATVGRRASAAAQQILNGYNNGRATLATQLNQLDLTPAQRQRILVTYARLGAPVREGNRTVQDAARKLSQLASGADQVANGNERLAGAVPALTAGISRAADGADQLAAGSTRLQRGTNTLDTGLGRVASGATTLSNKLSEGASQIPASDQRTRDRLAKTIGNPVTVTNSSDATAASYGAGLAPFFLALAAWIGGYVLFTQIRPLSRRANASNQAPLRVAVGGWLAPTALGAIQMTLALAAVSLLVGIRPANIPLTLVFMVLASAVFIAVVQTLTAWFGLAGQFLGLVLMIIQLITAGGTFPWQTIPMPLHPIHHLLPMSYAVDGLRQLMYGGLDSLVWRDVGVMLIWLILALTLTARAARRQRVWTPRALLQNLAG